MRLFWYLPYYEISTHKSPILGLLGAISETVILSKPESSICIPAALYTFQEPLNDAEPPLGIVPVNILVVPT